MSPLILIIIQVSFVVIKNINKVCIISLIKLYFRKNLCQAIAFNAIISHLGISKNRLEAFNASHEV